MDLTARQYLRWLAGCVLCTTLLVASMNFVVDPFDRHGVIPEPPLARQEISYSINRPLFELHRFDRFVHASQGHTRCVIVGDSRANQLDEDILNSTGDARWFNFSFGGATFGDSLALVEHLLGRDVVHVLVFSLSFLRFDGTSNEQQVRRALAEYGSPFPYITSTSTRASLENLLHAASGMRLTENRPHMSRHEFWRYILARKEQDLAQWRWPDALLDALHRIQKHARSKGVRFVFMIPPDSPDIARLMTQMLPEEVARFDTLLVQSECIDLRQGFGATLTNEHFRDPLHLEHAAAEAFSHAFVKAFHATRSSQRVASTAGNTASPLRPDAVTPYGAAALSQ